LFIIDPPSKHTNHHEVPSPPSPPSIFIHSFISFSTCHLCGRIASETAHIYNAIVAVKSVLEDECELVNFESLISCAGCLQLLEFIIRRRAAHPPPSIIQQAIDELCQLQIEAVRESISLLPSLDSPRSSHLPPPPPPSELWKSKSRNRKGGECDMCGKELASKFQLRAHIESHIKKEFICNIKKCPFKSRDAPKLLIHTLNVHSEIPFAANRQGLCYPEIHAILELEKN
jgi:hypothetical protein